MKKTFKYLIASIIVALTILIGYSQNKKQFVEASDDLPTVNVTCSTTNPNDSTQFYPNTSGNIYIVITLTSIPTSSSTDIIVKFHAEDRTAVCEAGDYYYTGGTAKTTEEKVDETHEATSITLNAKTTTYGVNYYTGKSDLAVSLGSGKPINSYFVFVIDEVINGAKPTQCEYQCAIKYNETINATKKSNGYQFTEYGNYTYSYYNFSESELSHSYSWKESIKLLDCYDEGTAHNCGCYNGGGIKCDRTKVINEYIKTGLAAMYVKAYLLYAHGTANKNELDFNLYEGHSTSNKKLAFERWCWVWKDRGLIHPTNNSEVLGGEYSKIDPKYEDKVYLTVWNASAWDRYAQVQLYGYLIDKTLNKATGYYVDSSSVGTKGVIRFLLRFDEPMQINGDTSKVALLGSAGDLNDIKFHYVAGNYTDTLVFEADVLKGEDLEQNNKLYKKITVDTFENYTFLSDFGYNWNGSVNKYQTMYKVCNGSATCNIDLREPTLSVNSSDMLATTQGKDISLTVGNFGSGRVYYTWKTTKDDPSTNETDYTSFFDIVKDGKSEHTFTIRGDSMNGEYYLHVLIVSRYGKKKVIVSGRTTSTGTELGGYLFDNSPPVLSGINLAVDTLTEKTFQIAINDNSFATESGVYALYISVATKADKSDAKTYCLWKYDLSVNKVGITPTAYQMVDTTKFAYLNGGNDVVQESYGGQICFSSKEQAEEFFKFYEFQDLQLLTLSGSLVDDIENMGVKAEGETKTAVAGQAWIRYKKASWTPNCLTDLETASSNWVYYYYSDGATTIDPEKISENLENAMTQVGKTIAQSGNNINLFDKGYVKNNLPYLKDSQVKVNCAITKNKVGQVFTSQVEYSDNNIRLTDKGGICTLLLKAEVGEIINLAQNKFGEYYIGFYAVDKSNNSSASKIEYKKYRFDRRILFDCEASVKQNDINTSSLDNNVNCYDLDQGSIEFTFEAKLKEGEQGTLSVGALTVGGNLIDPSEYSTYLNVGTATNNGTVLTCEPLKAGFYQIEMHLVDGGTSKVCDPFEYYITQSMQDETYNYGNTKNNIVLNNQVFQLTTKYYYMTSSRFVISESYSNSYLAKDPTMTISDGFATFSSKEVAREYVRYMEYQDFYLQILDQYAADALNQRSTDKNYVKADGETHTALAGEAWVRYKRRSWQITSTETDWVYYYLGDLGTTTIENSLISNSQLNIAVGDVVTYILGLGIDTYLVGDNTDIYGAPYVHPTQGHPDLESVNVTKSGSQFSSSISFSGDKNLYKNNITDPATNAEVPLVTNVSIELKENTRVFFAFFDNSVSEEMLEFFEVSGEAGTIVTYRDAIGNATTGTYIIREFGNEGVNQYRVYIDKTAPTLQTSYTSAVENKNYNLTLSPAINGSTYSVKRFVLGELDRLYEYDTYCYVAIYQKDKLKATYFYSYLIDNSVTLDNGNYTIIVGDRSGNTFSFNVLANDEELFVEISTPENNNCVQVKCNREVSQIYRYEVYLNNNPIPIDKEYTGETKRYYQDGYYRIYIEDIYGFFVEENGDGGGYGFERDLPILTWSYLNANGSYTAYVDGQTMCMSIVSSIGSKFYVNSSRRLRFQYEGDYTYVINDLEASEYKVSPLTGAVTIESDKDWSMEIWYTKYPEIKATYYCTMDTLPPDINVTIKKSTYALDEDEYIESLVNTGKAGDIYVPQSIGYYFTASNTTSISDGEEIDSNLIKLDFYDKSGLQSAKIYLDGELLREFDFSVDVNETVTLSRYGEYTLFATDSFGNEGTKTFVNKARDDASYYVDETLIPAFTNDLHYGNSKGVLTLDNDCALAFMVTDPLSNATDGSNKHLIMFTVENGTVTISKYINVLDPSDPTSSYFFFKKNALKGLNSLGEEIEIDDVIFSISDPSYRKNRYYQIQSTEINGMDLQIKYDENKLLYFMISCVGEPIDVQVRASFGEDKEPYYYHAYLSKELTDVNLQTIDSKVIEINHDGITYTNNDFDIIGTIPEEVTLIEMAYSDRNEFDEITTVYPYIDPEDKDQNVKLLDFDTSENGFYLLRIYNRYGNLNELIINRSDIYSVLTVAKYDDNTESRFNSEYEGITKANKYVSIEAYAKSATFDITRDGHPYIVSIINENSCYYITLSDEGTYVVTTIDNFGNTVIKNIEIYHSNLEYKEDLISGYNELALRKAEGYTNYKLSVVSDKVIEYNIKYISIIKDENEKVLYNGLTQYVVDYSPESLIQAIGNDGDGIYTVVFRDEFGSIAKKVINYRTTPTLSISRNILATKEAQEITVSSALANGAWSNHSITFESVAEQNIFKIDNEIVYLPKTVAFANQVATQGDFTYKVYYLDEYGFEYEFEAHLYRRELKIEFDPFVNIEIINDLETTNSTIIAYYTANTTCTYVIGSGEPVEYQQGEKLYRDGRYRFTVSDIAGNTTSRALKKDTIVEFEFIEEATGRILQNGDVCNYNLVKYHDVNNDSFLEKVYRDGELINNEGQSSFAKQGHYAIVVSDEAHNSVMFEFYIIIDVLKEFHYVTPNTYHIDEVWYSVGDGNTQSYMSSGTITHTDLNSEFTINENGEYTVIMTSTIYNDGMSFSFIIDNTPPNVKLVGCKPGETTLEDIEIKGYEVGDTIYIYKDGELFNQIEVTTKNVEVPKITTGGEYTIVVENQAGVTTTLQFKHIYIANTSGSILIIVACLAVVAGIITGVMIRNKQKFDD